MNAKQNLAQLWSFLAVRRRAVLANKQLGKFVTPAKEKTPTMCKALNMDQGEDPKYVCKTPNRNRRPNQPCASACKPTLKAGLHVAIVGPES